MTKSKYLPHIFALSFLFVLGNTVIFMPYHSMGVSSIWVFAVISVFLLGFFISLFKLGQKNKIVFSLAVVATGAVAIYGGVTAFLDFLAFLKDLALPKTNVWIVVIGFVSVVVIFCLSKQTAIYKYSLLVAVLCAGIILTCFVSGIKTFDFQGADLPLKFSFKFKDYIKPVLTVIVFPAFTRDEKSTSKAVFCGALTGFVGLAVCFLQSVFALGGQSDVAFPYLKAVGVISSGSLFTRLDGLVYFLFFVTSLIKITICIKVFIKCLCINKI